MNDNKKPWLMITIGVVVVALIILVACMLFVKSGSGDSAIKKDKYQAIFLTNGQVYFGKLSKVDDKYVELTDIYYLQVQQDVQPAEKDDNPQVSLAKLGSELHGPDDKMSINRDQVLFWENLKDDGKVAKAIAENKQQK